MDERIECENCGENDVMWKGYQDGTTECLHCGHDRTTGKEVVGLE